MRKLLLFLIVFTFVIGSFSLFAEEEVSFGDFMKEVGSKFKTKEYDDVLKLLESGIEKYPDHTYRLTRNIIMVSMVTENYEKMIDGYSYGHKKGLYYPIYIKADPWKKLLKENKRFQVAYKKNLELLAEAGKDVKARHKVVPPKDYTADKKYPLLIILHGWGMSEKATSRSWYYHDLGKDTIMAFLGSSQLVGIDSYGWDDLEIAHKDVQSFYKELIGKYSIDNEKVIIGGFSQGGRTAIDVVFKQTIPAKGFVVQAPGGGIPESITKEAADKLNSMNIRGVISTGAKDHSIAEQKEMSSKLKALGFEHKLDIIEGLVHFYPKDFGERLQNSIKYVIKGGK